MIIEEEKVEIIEDDKNKKEQKETTEFKHIKTDEKINKKSIFTYCGLFLLALFTILALIFVIFTFINLNNKNIAKGVYISGVDISGLSKEEAKKKVLNYFSEQVSNKEITLVYEDFETTINPSEINLKFNTDSAVNYAYSIGKNGNLFYDNYDIFDAMLNGINIIPTYSFNTEALESILNNLSKELPNKVIESDYYIEDSKLVITKGFDGYIINVAQTLNDIKQSISNLSYLSQPIELNLTAKSPEPVDIDKIYKEVYKEATDAYYTTNPYAVYPSSNGLDFNISLDEAKKLLAESENEFEIPLKKLYPNVTTNMLGMEAFPDLLATFSTKYAASNTNRTTNLKLAANKINGLVLLPGETFSYNQVVGERTIAAGYKEAAIYQNGQVVDGLGGGICQISTTLFNAALYANLEITEIHNHQFVPSYVGAGRDATVVYGSKDFKFKNSRNYAIKIECSVSGGIAKFSIYGLREQQEYDVTISAKVTSRTSSNIKSTTYRILKQNGQTIKTEKIYNCTYLVH